MWLLIVILAAGLAYTLPMDLAFLMAVDLSVYLDALVGVYLIANLVKVRPALHLARAAVGRLIRRFGARAKRSARVQSREAQSADNDDWPEPARNAA